MTRKREEILEDIAYQCREMRMVANDVLKAGRRGRINELLAELDASGKIDGHALLAWLSDRAEETVDDRNRASATYEICAQKVREMMSEAE